MKCLWSCLLPGASLEALIYIIHPQNKTALTYAQARRWHDRGTPLWDQAPIGPTIPFRLGTPLGSSVSKETSQ